MSRSTRSGRLDEMTPVAVPPRSRALGQERARLLTTASGALLAAASLPFALAHCWTAATGLSIDWLRLIAAGVASCLVLAAATVVRRHQLGRSLATLGTLGLLGLGAPCCFAIPLYALATLIAVTWVLVSLWGAGAPLVGPGRARRRPPSEGRAQGAGIAATAMWLVWTLAGWEHTLVSSLVVGWAVVMSAGLSVAWALRHLTRKKRRAWVLLAAVGGAGACVPLAVGNAWWIVSLFVGPAACAAVLLHPAPSAGLEPSSWLDSVLGHPERLFVGTFAALCLGGTVLLAFPPASASGEGIGLVDAAFTSTSAVCVTGLIVLDTPAAFSALGQGIILLLIQVGGLGIMTFSTAAVWALGGRMSMRHEGAVASLISTRDRGRLFETAKRILYFTVTAEAAGAALLSTAFILRGDSLSTGLWRGLFTSVSAFCNAGFALQSDSLIPYQDSPFILHTVGVLIILGGLSPLAVFALPAIVRRSTDPVSAQARLALIAAGALLVGGFFFTLAFEWSHALGDLPVADKLHNAWFQSVTLRTAGFNSIDFSNLRQATLTLMLPWMFIGGSPGGTAGGVKTTTVSIFVLSVFQAVRGRWTLEAFGRTIPERTRAKAGVVVAIALTTGVMALVAVELTQDMPTKLAVFEVVSALGTVGLSIGGTAELDGIGKAIILICMFVGRVGGLSLLMFLSSRRAEARLGRPEEEIDVG